MVSRRQAIFGIIPISALIGIPSMNLHAAVGTELPFDQLTYPPFEAMDNPEPFGYDPATAEQRRKADEIVIGTPKGPRPIDIAQSFVDRYSKSGSNFISQWPAPSAWNPLIVEFFSATSMRVNSDMIAWCAAFVNWCIERTGRNGSRSAASQSFLDQRVFKPIVSPNIGDLVVFTCLDDATGKSVNLGHVGFVKEKPLNGRLKVLGGNQSDDGHSSIISERYMSTADRQVRRQVGSEYKRCTMKLNRFVSMA